MAEVSETIADGFVAVRQARGTQLMSLTHELARIGEGHPGITVYSPYEETDKSTRTVVRLVGNRQVARNSQAIGHLGRRSVYKALQDDPALSARLNLTTTGVMSRDRVLPSGDHPLGFTFDQESVAKLEDDCTSIRQILAHLAGLSERQSRALRLPRQVTNFTVATVSPETPNSVLEAMRGTLEERVGIPLIAKGVWMVPALPALPAPAEVPPVSNV